MPENSTRIPIKESCDPRLASAVLALQSAVSVRTGQESRRLPIRSIRLLVAEHIEPAFESAIAEVPGVSDARLLLKSWFGRQGLKAVLGDTRRLHLCLKEIYSFLRRPGTDDEKLRALFGTMHEVEHYLSCWPLPRRVVPAKNRGKKGAALRLRHVEDRSELREWPYCELCWRLSESAELIENKGGDKGVQRDETLNERFCKYHSRKNGALYRRDQKNKERFCELIRAIYEEFAIDISYRRLFNSPDDDDAWELTKSLTPEKVLSIASLGLTPVSTLQMNVRKIAYQIARRKPSAIERVTDIIRLKETEGLLQKEVAERMALKEQEVSRTLNRTPGCVDLNRHSTLLRWWPYEDISGEGIFRVRGARTPARTSHSRTNDWREPALPWLAVHRQMLVSRAAHPSSR